MSSTITDDIASVLLELSLRETDIVIITSVAQVLVELDLLGGDQE